MIKLIAASILVLLIVSSASLNATDAVISEKQSDFKYVKERIVEPLKGHTGWWKYLLTVCADDYSLAITEIVLSSDTEVIYQGVNKAIPKGDCSHYGAVMKAKNGASLGYKITLTSEAVQKILDSKNGKLDGTNWSEIGRYKFILGFY